MPRRTCVGAEVLVYNCNAVLTKNTGISLILHRGKHFIFLLSHELSWTITKKKLKEGVGYLTDEQV